MIGLGARYGEGLPADVIPMEVPALAAFGHAEMLAGLALGYRDVAIVAGPRTDRATIGAEIALASAVLCGARPGDAPRIALIEETDPDALITALRAPAPEPHGAEPILASGGRRETVRLAARALATGETAEPLPLPLPDGAPYGAVVVDTDACTLCLACAGLCPTGALGDNADRPELSIREEACIQCGLCAGLCPERAIRLVPQLDLSEAALAPRILNAEEPLRVHRVRQALRREVRGREDRRQARGPPDVRRLGQGADVPHVRRLPGARPGPRGGRAVSTGRPPAGPHRRGRRLRADGAPG